eukprot:3513528-Prymnesium_polylepis.1
MAGGRAAPGLDGRGWRGYGHLRALAEGPWTPRAHRRGDRRRRGTIHRRTCTLWRPTEARMRVVAAGCCSAPWVGLRGRRSSPAKRRRARQRSRRESRGPRKGWRPAPPRRARTPCRGGCRIRSAPTRSRRRSRSSRRPSGAK